MPKSRQMGEKAISINPNLGSAYTAIAWVQYHYDYDWENAEHNFKKGIMLNPNNATGFHWYAIFLLQTGRVDNVYPTMKKATVLDPQSMIIKNDFAFLCWSTGKVEYDQEAIQSVEEALKMDPYFPPALRQKYFRYDNHDPAEGIKLYQQAREIYPNQPWIIMGLFELNWKTGNKQLALENVVELLDKHKDYISRSAIAEIYFEMGKTNDGLRWLEKSSKIKEPTFMHLANIGRRFRHLISNPRFRQMYKKINHPLYVD